MRNIKYQGEWIMKVSVIIPVYNGEEYLRQCLDSVVSQTLKDIEIICVDDGSTDSSLDILKEYQEKDSRFRYYCQQNLYAGIARNLGKSHASGEYLVFWDCDDFFEPEALECLYNRAKETDADICVCGANRYFNDTEKTVPHPGYLKTDKVPEEDTFSRDTNPYILNFTTAVPWNKIFRRSFVEREKLDFQGVRNGNDIYFVSTALCLADRVSVVDKALVNYRVNRGQSLVGSLSKSPLTPLKAWAAVAEELEKRNAFPEQSFVNRMLASAVLSLFQNVHDWTAFCTIMDYLKKEGFRKLHLEQEHPQEYYFVAWHKELAEMMLAGQPEELAVFLLNQACERSNKASGDLRLTKKKLEESRRKNKEKNDEIKRLKKEVEKLEKENTELKQSAAYKIGSGIVWLPQKVKHLFK